MGRTDTRIRQYPDAVARPSAPRFDVRMNDPFIREKFTREHTAARKLANEYFQRYPKDRYQTEVESWRNLQSANIEFTMKRLREPIPGDRMIQAMKEPKRLFRVALYKEGTTPVEICSAMRHEGEIWLVPDWIRSPRGRSAKPLRMIPLSKFSHKEFPLTSEAFADYAIDGVVPKGLFDRHIPPVLSAAFGVLERPAIRVQMGRLATAADRPPE